MIKLEALNFATREEAILTYVKVEMLERAIAEAHNGILLAYGAFGVVARRFRCRQTMHDGQPDNRLRLQFDPLQKMLQTYLVRRL